MRQRSLYEEGRSSFNLAMILDEQTNQATQVLSISRTGD